MKKCPEQNTKLEYILIKHKLGIHGNKLKIEHIICIITFNKKYAKVARVVKHLL